MLRRLDPILWKEFNDVVRYVLPLMIKSMEVGPDNLQEVGSILANERKQSMGSDTFPLSHDQVGYVRELLDQEDSRQA